MIAKTRAEFPLKVSTKRFTQNYCFQESGWLPLPVAHQITGHTNFPWKPFAKTLMWRHIMQKIPWFCKFNILFIWLKIATVSAWNFKFQISCFLYLKTFEVYIYIYIYIMHIMYLLYIYYLYLIKMLIQKIKCIKSKFWTVCEKMVKTSISKELPLLRDQNLI